MEVVVGGALPGALEEAKAGQVLDVDNGLGGLDVVADNIDGKDLHGCRWIRVVDKKVML